MKAVILAGGLGTRISEETHVRPKPMIEIGGRPILWHIMKLYSHHKVNEFVICCGYKGYVIKDYFLNYSSHVSDLQIDLENNSIEILNKPIEPWKINLIDTGMETMTGGRLKRVANYLKNEEAFCFTYGDGVADINITELIDFHLKKNKLATISAVYPPGRYGALEITGDTVTSFKEKPKVHGGYINGGFFVLSPKVIDLIESDETSWELEPLAKLAEMGQLNAYNHDGFWQPMDTLREKNLLQKMWETGRAPWKVWQ